MVYLLTMVPVAGPLGRPQVPAPSIPGYGVLTMVPVWGPPGRPRVPAPCLDGDGVTHARGADKGHSEKNIL